MLFVWVHVCVRVCVLVWVCKCVCLCVCVPTLSPCCRVMALSVSQSSLFPTSRSSASSEAYCKGERSSVSGRGGRSLTLTHKRTRSSLQTLIHIIMILIQEDSWWSSLFVTVKALKHHISLQCVRLNCCLFSNTLTHTPKGSSGRTLTLSIIFIHLGRSSKVSCLVMS